MLHNNINDTDMSLLKHAYNRGYFTVFGHIIWILCFFVHLSSVLRACLVAFAQTNPLTSPFFLQIKPIVIIILTADFTLKKNLVNFLLYLQFIHSVADVEELNTLFVWIKADFTFTLHITLQSWAERFVGGEAGPFLSCVWELSLQADKELRHVSLCVTIWQSHIWLLILVVVGGGGCSEKMRVAVSVI